jgi:hypothetical protein
MKKIILAIILTTFYFIGLSQNSEINTAEHFQLSNQVIYSGLKIYPNPCKLEKVTIESNEKYISEILITNIAGKQVYKKKFITPEIKFQVDLSEFTNGIYLVKIKTEDNMQVVKKLILSKD